MGKDNRYMVLEPANPALIPFSMLVVFASAKLLSEIFERPCVRFSRFAAVE